MPDVNPTLHQTSEKSHRPIVLRQSSILALQQPTDFSKEDKAKKFLERVYGSKKEQIVVKHSRSISEIKNRENDSANRFI